MAKRNTLIFPNFRTDPIGYIFLIHWVLVCVVFTGTRCVHITTSNIWFQSKRKLRKLATSFLRLCRIPEIKITENSIIVWSRSLFISCIWVATLILSEFHL